MAKQSMMTQMTRITLEQIRHSERVAPEKNCSRIILIKKMEKHDSGLKSLKKCKYVLFDLIIGTINAGKMSLSQCTFLKITDDSAAENYKRGLAVLIVIVKYQICTTRRYVLNLGWVGPVFWLVSAFLASCKPLVFPILANFSSIFLLIGNF